MIEELKEAILTRDLPKKGLKAGDVGTVVAIHEGAGQDEAAGYTTEFMTLTGATVAVAAVTADHVRPVAEGDIVHARAV